MKTQIKKIKDLKDGDVFYFDLQDTYEFENDELENLMYGSDIVGIVDDSCEAFNGTLYLNYFGMIRFKNKNQKVKVIAHYSKLIK
tara:strand:- start:111 stop:365 length:255 start_codon:yes stop_codon:yes gene_type:complete